MQASLAVQQQGFRSQILPSSSGPRKTRVSISSLTLVKSLTPFKPQVSYLPQGGVLDEKTSPCITSVGVCWGVGGVGAEVSGRYCAAFPRSLAEAGCLEVLS